MLSLDKGQRRALTASCDWGALSWEARLEKLKEGVPKEAVAAAEQAAAKKTAAEKKAAEKAAALTPAVEAEPTAQHEALLNYQKSFGMPYHAEKIWFKRQWGTLSAFAALDAEARAHMVQAFREGAPNHSHSGFWSACKAHASAEQLTDLEAQKQLDATTLRNDDKEAMAVAQLAKELAFKYEGGSDAFQMLPASEQLARARAARGMQAEKQSVVRGLAAERRKEGACNTCKAVAAWRCDCCGKCVPCEHESPGKDPGSYLCGNCCFGGCGRCPDCSGHGCTCYEVSQRAARVDVTRNGPAIKGPIMCSAGCVQGNAKAVEGDRENSVWTSSV